MRSPLDASHMDRIISCIPHTYGSHTKRVVSSHMRLAAQRPRQTLQPVPWRCLSNTREHSSQSTTRRSSLRVRLPAAPVLARAGVCLFVITAGALPFDEPNLGLLFKKIQKADYQTPAWFSRDLAHLLRAIITPDPKARSAPLAVCLTMHHAPCHWDSACCVLFMQQPGQPAHCNRHWPVEGMLCTCLPRPVSDQAHINLL